MTRTHRRVTRLALIVIAVCCHEAVGSVWTELGREVEIAMVDFNVDARHPEPVHGDVNEDRASIAERLNAALSDTLKDREEISRVIEAAHRSGEAELVPLLLKVATGFCQDHRHSLAFEALGTAASLADITDKLLEFAREHEQNPCLASYSIDILGREPDAGMMKILERVHNESRNNQVRGAVQGARRVFSLEQKRASFKQRREEIDFIVAHLGETGWDPITLGVPHVDIPQGLVERTMQPTHVWSQRHVRRLSKEHPSLVARAVFETDKYKDMGEIFNRSYRNYLAKRFLSPAAQAEYQRLQQN